MSHPYEYLPPPPPSPRHTQHPVTLSDVGPVPGAIGGRGAVSLQAPERPRTVPAPPPVINTSLYHRPLVNSPLGPGAAGAAQSATLSIVGYLPTAVRPLPTAPATAFGVRSPVSNALTPSSASPASASPMEPYNPRQWSGIGQVSGSQVVFARSTNATPSTRGTTGMEAALPSPPPPYSAEASDAARSPASSNRMSAMMETMYAPSPVAIDSPARQAAPGQTTISPAFPPPPGTTPPGRHRERSSSGLGGQRSIFSHLRGKQPSRTDAQLSPSPQAPVVIDARPPAARRAASTGHINPLPMAPTQSERSSPDNGWQPGMPLPGPPPGPPPSGSRSQSLNRIPGSASSQGNSTVDPSFASRGTSRRVAAASSLGPVPPTPAGWTEQAPIPAHEPPLPSQPRPAEQHIIEPLRIDTSSNKRDSLLARRPATRDTSAQGIRERRSRSRQARSGDIMSPDGDESRPSDLVFTPVHGAISQRREFGRTKHGGISSAPSSATLPHTTGSLKPGNSSTVMTPPYTPAVNDGDGARKPLRVPGSASSDRPISHLLHAPNEDSSMQAPLSPARPMSSDRPKSTETRLDVFALQALERHRAFVEMEATASSDEERLGLFAQFIVHESRLRRDRYATAYNTMAGDIVDLTRDMWRSYARDGKRAVTPSTTMSSVDHVVSSWASDGQPSAHMNGPSSASSFGEATPGTDASPAMDSGDLLERSESRQWGEVFKPSLSPIPSMAVSTVPDDDSSRGRQPSRWWEQSASGGGSIGRPDRIERSHRETKYMGINPASLVEGPQESPREHGYPVSSGSSQVYGSSEYPPEKVGWHEDAEFDTPMPTPGRRHRPISDIGVHLLDVSRLVTLPPPYPRHHPALNNSHPLLSELRTTHRQLADQSDIRKIKDGYLDQDYALQRQQQDAAKERKAMLRTSIQEKISNGAMTFAEAAQAEAKFNAEEPERGKTNARATFDLYEVAVAHPLNVMLTERLAKANACMKQLQAELDRHNEVSDPNQAQEEGDGQPERLEKLTLFKWLFEAREQLHKEMSDLHAQRSEKYSEVILTPYRIAKLQHKIDEATAFFAKDAQERHLTFARESLARYEALQKTMESNVSRGVEDQLSAFWDIAPSLNSVIQSIPDDRHAFDVDIPAAEYEENPAYHDYPLQYLYTLLNHAEKSAFQFIESQTNLLCLLHEVRTATAKASSRKVEDERTETAVGDTASIWAEVQRGARAEEERLTDDLKDKVGEVERQWQEALGEEVQRCKAQVRSWLEETGGWEDGLD